MYRNFYLAEIYREGNNYTNNTNINCLISILMSWNEQIIKAIRHSSSNKCRWHRRMLLVNVFLWMPWVIWKAFYLLLFIRHLTGKLGTVSFAIAEVISLVCKICLSVFKAGLSADISLRASRSENARREESLPLLKDYSSSRSWAHCRSTWIIKMIP